MQINQYQQQNQRSNPTFGVHYTKKTVKRLKQLIPDMVRETKNEQDYSILRTGFEHLIEAGKSVDNFLVDINDDYIRGFQFLDIRVKKRNGKVKDFLYPDGQHDIKWRTHTNIGDFCKKCEFINSPDFKKESESVIEEWATHRSSQSKWKNFKDDMFWVWNYVTEKVEDCVDTVKDLFAVAIDLPSGTKEWYPKRVMKDWFANKKYQIELDSANADRITELRKLADKMRTKPIDIQIKNYPVEIKPEENLIESSQKLLENK